MTAHLNVHEPKPPDDPDSPLAFSMEGSDGRAAAVPDPALLGAGVEFGAVPLQVQYRAEERARGGPSGPAPPGTRANGAAHLLRGPPSPGGGTPAGKVLVVPLYHVFGSEELSALAPGIARLSPAPYLALNPADAGDHGLQDAAAGGDRPGRTRNPSSPPPRPVPAGGGGGDARGPAGTSGDYASGAGDPASRRKRKRRGATGMRNLAVIFGVLIAALAVAGREHLAREAAPRPLAGPLRSQPGGPLRSPPGRWPT